VGTEMMGGGGLIVSVMLLWNDHLEFALGNEQKINAHLMEFLVNIAINKFIETYPHLWLRGWTL
jgi:hypothetical protein